MCGIPESGSSTTHSSPAHWCRITFDGSTPKRYPQADFCPHRFRPVCDHASGKDSLRNPIVMPFQARWSAKYSSDSIASIEIAPAPKGFLPPATRDLGCAIRNDPPGIPGVRTGSPQGTCAAISDLKCRQEGDAATYRDRPALLHHAMMPSQAILPDCADESCTATLEPLIQGEQCHYRHRKSATKLPITGVRRGSHRKSNGLSDQHHQTPGGRRDPGWSSPTHNVVYLITMPIWCQRCQRQTFPSWNYPVGKTPLKPKPNLKIDSRQVEADIGNNSRNS